MAEVKLGEHVSQCTCDPWSCARKVEPPSDCLFRLEGGVTLLECPAHRGLTWHHNGECCTCAKELRERKELRDSQEVRQDAVNVPTVGSTPTPAANPSNPLGFSVTVSNTQQGTFTVEVTDKKKVIRLLKILLEDK